jgi:ribosomal protein S18 acetylase RimI-like enzyme
VAIPLHIARLGPGDEDRVLAAGLLFDAPPRPEAVRRFFADPNHHLLLASAGGKAVGFVSGVELTHPDKGTEMFLYELAVDESHRRQGVGAALAKALRDLARERGCYDMWVLTDDDNEAALGAYRKSGATEESRHVMLTWPIEP